MATSSISEFVKEVEKAKADAAHQRKFREQAEGRAKEAISVAKQSDQAAEQARKALAEARDHQAALEAAHQRVAVKAADRDNVAAELATVAARLKQALKDADAASARADTSDAARDVAVGQARDAEAKCASCANGTDTVLVAAVRARAEAERQISKLL